MHHKNESNQPLQDRRRCIEETKGRTDARLGVDSWCIKKWICTCWLLLFEGGGRSPTSGARPNEADLRSPAWCGRHEVGRGGAGGAMELGGRGGDGRGCGGGSHGPWARPGLGRRGALWPRWRRWRRRRGESPLGRGCAAASRSRKRQKRSCWEGFRACLDRALAGRCQAAHPVPRRGKSDVWD